MEEAMHNAFIWSSIITGFLSGALWLYASTITVPTNIGSGYGTLVGVEEMTVGLKKQAIWNSYAAVNCGSGSIAGFRTNLSLNAMAHILEFSLNLRHRAASASSIGAFISCAPIPLSKHQLLTWPRQSSLSLADGALC